MPEIHLELAIGDRTIDATIQIPVEPMRPIDLLPVLQDFTDALISTAIEDSPPISCTRGCGACCRQLVPIAESEALFLAKLIEEMPAVKERFARLLEAVTQAGLMDRLRNIRDTSLEERTLLGTSYFQLGLACPFLEEESCGIHPDRPLSCREYLVTSPAVNCKNPGPGIIQMVPLPAKPSLTLYRFSDGTGTDIPRWLPMPLLLEFAAGHKAEDQPRLPGKDLLGNFVRTLADN